MVRSPDHARSKRGGEDHRVGGRCLTIGRLVTLGPCVAARVVTESLAASAAAGSPDACSISITSVVMSDPGGEVAAPPIQAIARVSSKSSVVAAVNHSCGVLAPALPGAAPGKDLPDQGGYVLAIEPSTALLQRAPLRFCWSSWKRATGAAGQPRSTSPPPRQPNTAPTATWPLACWLGDLAMKSKVEDGVGVEAERRSLSSGSSQTLATAVERAGSLLAVLRDLSGPPAPDVAGGAGGKHRGAHVGMTCGGQEDMGLAGDCCWWLEMVVLGVGRDEHDDAAARVWRRVGRCCLFGGAVLWSLGFRFSGGACVRAWAATVGIRGVCSFIGVPSACDSSSGQARPCRLPCRGWRCQPGRGVNWPCTDNRRQKRVTKLSRRQPGLRQTISGSPDRWRPQALPRSSDLPRAEVYEARSSSSPPSTCGARPRTQRSSFNLAKTPSRYRWPNQLEINAVQVTDDDEAIDLPKIWEHYPDGPRVHNIYGAGEFKPASCSDRIPPRQPPDMRPEDLEDEQPFDFQRGRHLLQYAEDHPDRLRHREPAAQEIRGQEVDDARAMNIKADYPRWSTCTTRPDRSTSPPRTQGNNRRDWIQFQDDDDEEMAGRQPFGEIPVFPSTCTGTPATARHRLVLETPINKLIIRMPRRSTTTASQPVSPATQHGSDSPTSTPDDIRRQASDSTLCGGAGRVWWLNGRQAGRPVRPPVADNIMPIKVYIRMMAQVLATALLRPADLHPAAPSGESIRGLPLLKRIQRRQYLVAGRTSWRSRWSRRPGTTTRPGRTHRPAEHRHQWNSARRSTTS